MTKKIKLTSHEKRELEKLKKDTQKSLEKLAWEMMSKESLKKLDLYILKSKWRRRYEIRREILMDKYLVTLRPWANRFKNKRPEGLGWKDDA